MESITVSVAVLAYNHEKYIKAALDSVLKQEVNFSYEIIIGEDKSTDSTREILLDYKERYPDIINLILNDENVGGSKNYYNVIRKCSGKYIAILESDDYWTEISKLQQQVDFLEQNPEFTAVIHGIQGKNGNGDVVAIYPHKKFLGKEFQIKDFIQGHSFPLMGMLFRNLQVLQINWELVCQGPRNMGDFTITIAILNAGRVYIMSHIMAAYNIKNSKDETNYNSIYNWKDKYSQLIKIINLNTFFYNGKYDFSYWYGKASTIALLYAIKYKERESFIRIFKEIPYNIRYKLFYHVPCAFIRVIWDKFRRYWVAKVKKISRQIHSL